MPRAFLRCPPPLYAASGSATPRRAIFESANAASPPSMLHMRAVRHDALLKPYAGAALLQFTRCHDTLNILMPNHPTAAAAVTFEGNAAAAYAAEHFRRPP